MRSIPLHRIVDTLAARSGIPFAVTAPDGSTVRGGGGEPAFTLRFRSEAAMLAIVARGHMALLEAYFDGRLDIDGDFAAAMAAGNAATVDPTFDVALRAENRLHELGHSNRTREQARANAGAHYGLPESFYRLWLDDPLKMYTCAYWPEGTATLEEAQRNKIDHVCRKIRLAPGERFVDIGCGFGGFMFRAAERSGRPASASTPPPSRSTGCGARSAGAACGTGCRCARPTSATSTASTTRWCRSACSSTRAATSSPRWCARTPRSSGRAGSACCTSSATSAATRPSSSSASTSSRAAGSRRSPTSSSRWSGPAWRWSTSRTCAGTTR